MNPTRLTMLGLAVSFFLLGSVSGFAAGQRGELDQPAVQPKIAEPQPAEPGKAEERGKDRGMGMGMDVAMRALDRRLNLSPEQGTAIRAAIDKSREVCGGILRETRPRFEAARAELEQTIRGVLTPEQVTLYEELLKQRGPWGGMRRGGGFRNRGTGGPGGPGGHR